MEAVSHYIYKQVSSVVFGVLSPKMIKKMASAKIVTPELYDKEGYPVDGGLMDVRLGVIDPGLRCKTCGSKLKECIGHFGYIELARSVVHVKYARIIQLLLKSSCRECGRLMIAQEKWAKAKSHLDRIELEEGPESRRLAVKALIESKGGKCPHCKAKQSKISIEKPTTYIEGDKRVSPIEIRARFEKIPDEDIEVFGLNPKTARPEWMILTVLPIPPVTVRPSITLESGERSEDDLTHKLGDIVRINQRLFENINAGAPEIIIEDLWDLLQYHVTTFFDNGIAQLPPARHRSGQPLKTITERIKSKEGRIRHNLAGKRTNFCARTVISPDPMLGLDEVGVPKIIALKLTVPETVNEWNMAYLKKFVSNGPGKYPGANYVVRPDGKKKKITDETKEASLEELQPGYIVERHLMDGDVAIFNRQPSLHRMSMMCHRVRVLPGRTLRLNPAVCNPYNADFDGDEMNLHIPQTEEARAEAEILMQVQTQLISPRYGLSVIGCIQDAISGNYLLTKLGEMPREDAVQLLACVNVTDFSRLPSKKLVNGREIFSVLLPDEFDYESASRSGDKVVIRKGILMEGIIDTKSIGGEGEGLLLRSLHKKFGPARTIGILHQIFRLGIEYLVQHGFSTGIADEDLPQEAREQIDQLLHQAEEDVAQMIQSFKEAKLEVFPGRTMRETLELKILERLNKARNACGQIIKAFVQDKNHAAVMIMSGARGSMTSLIQMSACVGQQAMRGKRIEKGYRERTLSCFKRGDLSPEAHGFIIHSFKHGINPKEFFFHSITGRDALMDTALRTPKSGYLYRRLANAMQDLRVEYDGTVRDANGRIIQFAYGEDGIDVARSESGKIDVQRIINEN
ncbi:MAG: DNA-directed RNA polymerase subunit A' [Candidatus Woesearchaeota archaeon]|nr:DNA-directed RNA polymerase subunit A' [Candidatus Woesearchaeota archaeon]